MESPVAAALPRPAASKQTDNETVVFFHINKTAGLTVRQILENQYPPEQRFHVHDAAKNGPTLQDYLDLPDEEKAKFRCLLGHMPYQIKQHQPTPVVYFAFFREPLKRMISHYYWCISRENGIGKRIVNEQISLADFLLSKDITVQADNFQVRILANDEMVTNNERIDMTQPCDQAMLEKAVDRLERQFRIVCLQERFDESVLLLRHAFGWRTPYYKSKNVVKKKPARIQLPSDVEAAVKERNRFDYALYEYVTDRFERQVTQMGPDFERELHAFRLMNDIAFDELEKAR